MTIRVADDAQGGDRTMSTIEIERLQVTATRGSVNINYEHTRITYNATSTAATEPPDPIEMGPIIHDAEEVTS